MERMLGLPETLLIVLGAALLMAVVLGLVVRVGVRGGAAAVGPGGAQAMALELQSLRAADTELRQKLAVEEHRSSRVAVLETELAGLAGQLASVRDAKAAAEAALSARVAELAARDTILGDTRERLTAAAAARVALEGDLSAAKAAAADLQAAHATVRERLEQERRVANEKLVLLTSARAEMGQQFRTLAEEVMARHGENFSKLNREQIDGILTPLREKLSEFEKSVQASHVEGVKDRATLAEHIRHIADTGAVMGKETRELTQALRGKSQVQGAWGEMVLATILEQSGLRPDEEYTVQKSFRTEEGQRQRPDAVISMPGKQLLVVDAKVSLTAFASLVNAASDAERAEHLRSHLASIRSHIATLGAKDYHLTTGTTLDYVIMFVPIEGALAAALQADPSLMAFAAEKNVAITTPTTLMVALRTVANFWQVDRRNQNAEDIALRAGKLYEKFAGFAADMNSVGDSLSKARASYDQAMGKLTTGKGNVIRQLEQLKAMGGRTSKSLPTSLLDASEAGMSLAITTHTVETDVKIELTAQTRPVGGEGDDAPPAMDGAAEEP